jgi:molybdate transport system substrate-binding protein
MARLLAILVGLALGMPASAARLHVASAANFKSTLSEISSRFESQTDHQVVISSASTGVLYNQVIHGAPFDVLLAADAEHPRRLVDQGLADPDSRFTYARGLLVLAYRAEMSAYAQRGVAELLGRPGLSLVIANPELAPYGLAAKAVMNRYPLGADSRLLRATNVSQAFQMWYSGGADAALVAKSFEPRHFLPIPENWYPAIEQQAVLLKNSTAIPTARSFLEFLRSPDIRALIGDSGYGLDSSSHD